MSRFLVALIIPALLVMSRTVIAMTPLPATSLETRALGEVSTLSSAEPAVAAIGGFPESLSLTFLLMGLVGLAAAGNRPSQDRVPVKF